MEQYISKSAVVAEIERRLGELSQLEKASYEIGLYDACKIVLSFLYAIEVKEVDLDFEQELYKAFGQVKDFTLGMRIAKHFFELGLKAQKGE